MRAFWCGGDIGECADLIYAATAGVARYASYKIQEASCDLEFIEINVARAPGADQYYNPCIDAPYQVDCIGEKGVMIWREAGGHDETGSCESCGKGWFGDCELFTKPEWAICPGCCNCGECGCDDDCLK